METSYLACILHSCPFEWHQGLQKNVWPCDLDCDIYAKSTFPDFVAALGLVILKHILFQFSLKWCFYIFILISCVFSILICWKITSIFEWIVKTKQKPRPLTWLLSIFKHICNQCGSDKNSSSHKDDFTFICSHKQKYFFKQINKGYNVFSAVWHCHGRQLLMDTYALCCNMSRWIF